MDATENKPTHTWSFPQKLAFRFFFIYLALYMAPWLWLDQLEMVSFGEPFQMATDWAVNFGNKHLFHIKDELVPFNGSGDTSYGWAQLCLYLLLASVGSLLWSLLDPRRASYDQLFYWLRTFVRFYLSIYLFAYGIIKLFAMQMGFPNTSMLLTPLGDLLPMRLSWQFIGYSTPYQVFSGAMEVLAALLLLHRNTVTLGLLVATGVFTNVVMLNLCYDVPVKLFSSHLLFCSLFLLAIDGRRLISFFFKNEATQGTSLYQFDFPKKWMRIARIVVKTGFILYTFGWTTYDSYTYWISDKNQPDPKPLSGLYDVQLLTVNRDTVPILATDTVHWRDIVFEKGDFGTVGTTDTLFRQRYRRGFFAFETDSAAQTITLKKMAMDNLPICTLHYELEAPDRVKLRTVFRGDSLYMECVKSRRHFQLAERQFHWLSEANR